MRQLPGLVRSSRRLVALAALPLLAAGCSTLGGARSIGAPADERPFLMSPAIGWPGALPPDRAVWMQSLHHDLVASGEQTLVLSETAALLEREPEFLPARVLAAQARFLSGRYATVVDELAPLRPTAPGYVAAEVLYGRACEHLDRPLEAFAAYWSVQEASGVAAARVAALRDLAVGELAERLDSEVADGLELEAVRTLELLQLYAPADPRTVAAAGRVEQAAGDPLARLALLRRQTEAATADPELLRRRAELELEVGEAGSAVRLAERLVELEPADSGLVELLERARFQWRLDVLPAEVGALEQSARLSRADYAVLLYWLFPGVRYGQPSQGRIASDIIDHPQRERIVRVINLGLLDVDATVHRFEPDAPILRGPALRALLELIQGSSQPACLGPGADVPASGEGLCAAAARCRLLATAAECDPAAPLSGAAALELIRRTLAGLGAAA